MDPMHKAPVVCLSFAPDGRAVASGSHDETIIISDVVDGEMLQELKAHKGMYLFSDRLKKRKKKCIRSSPVVRVGCVDKQ